VDVLPVECQFSPDHTNRNRVCLRSSTALRTARELKRWGVSWRKKGNLNSPDPSEALCRYIIPAVRHLENEHSMMPIEYTIRVSTPHVVQQMSLGVGARCIYIPEGCDFARPETIRPMGPDPHHPSKTTGAHITETIWLVPAPLRPNPPGRNNRGHHRGYRWGRYYQEDWGDTAGAETTRAKTPGRLPEAMPRAETLKAHSSAQNLQQDDGLCGGMLYAGPNSSMLGRTVKGWNPWV
jgi:hypothetical protein